MDDGYEAMVFSSHLPSRTVTFVFPESGIPFAGGIFRIERVRTMTAEDDAAFPLPPEGKCAVCGHTEDC